MYGAVSETNRRYCEGDVRPAPIISMCNDLYFVDKDYVIPTLTDGTGKIVVSSGNSKLLIHMPLSWLIHNYRNREVCVKAAVALWVQRSSSKSFQFMGAKAKLAEHIGTSSDVISSGINELAEMGWVKRESRVGRADIITIFPPKGTSVGSNGCVRFDDDFIHQKIDVENIRSLGKQRGLALMVYLYLYRKAAFDRKMICRATSRWLSDQLGVAHNNICYIISRLEKEGLVSRKGKRGYIAVVPLGR